MGTAGFEPATSGTQSPNHTKLDYVPIPNKILSPNLSMTYYHFNNVQNQLAYCRLKII